MKQIRIGLTGHDHLSLKYRSVELHCQSNMAIFPAAEPAGETTEQKPLAVAHAGERICLSAQANRIKIEGLPISLAQPLKAIMVQHTGAVFVRLSGHPNGASVPYLQTIVIEADADQVRAFVQCDLDDYTQAVLRSEIPDSYHLEAIKAQAIAARTYALNPRIDHTSDHCQVCDSYLCCQAFSGKLPPANSRHAQAVAQTKGEVMIYEDKPILALFSSSAGGHTENFETCFSDLKTQAFPPAPIPYLKGVSEGQLPSQYKPTPNDQALAELWQCKEAKTMDAWAPQFKWSVRLSIETLEANMHNAVETLLNTKDMAPFVIPPSSQIFGAVDSFAMGKRGVGGTGSVLSVRTSKGTWQFKKELVIRSVFKNAEAKINRLKSARLYFEHERDAQGRLSLLVIHGLGYGHGVGLQQTGAQGWAQLAKKTYKQILEHYFTDIQIAQI